jgi:phosphopantetheinyl transferase
MLYHQWSPTPNSLAAIWHIDEDEEFFSKITGPASERIRHPKKRLEHLCGRFLLHHLRDDFPLLHIAPDKHDKPRLPDDQYFFSISHSYPYVAVVVSDWDECGIDLQTWKDNIAEISHMYLSPQERDLFPDNQLLTLAWSTKEAVYKWYGRRGNDFIRDMPIHAIGTEIRDGAIPELPVHMHCYGNELVVRSSLHRDFALALLIKDRPATNE